MCRQLVSRHRPRSDRHVDGVRDCVGLSRHVEPKEYVVPWPSSRNSGTGKDVKRLRHHTGRGSDRDLTRSGRRGLE